ncbi:MAG: glycosyltransferase family 4 protein [Planctomycetaceae bacterium]|nr:glycosyltransferase family 4 protein [Planctomycetaceae bacterium]MBV8308858.1 glycosyltransferase family 4 protein [Planctomycetaceae bacterium]
MRILFCSPVPLDPRLGMGKHWLELADSLRGLGWETHAVGPDEIAGGPTLASPETFSTALRDYLRRNAAGYDVIEYDHAYLPFPRSEFPSGPLFVARCMLLAHHFLTDPVPPQPGLWRGLRHILSAGGRRRRVEWIVGQTDATVRHTDLTIVSNDRDAAALVRNGADPDRIAVLPLGLTSQRLRQFAAVSDVVPDRPVVGFVGTFDPRKGMREFPRLVDRVSRQVAGATFRLLGTAGLVPDVDGVLRHFPRRLRPLLDVRPRFVPEELPGLLDGVSVGVFPSRVESFGYGVLEMLAAAVPVIAYDAPGPHAMLPADFRVEVGDDAEMAARVVGLLSDPARLRAARRWARARAGDFRWDEIAARTANVYVRRLAG